jgi:hypothetical protein
MLKLDGIARICRPRTPRKGNEEVEPLVARGIGMFMEDKLEESPRANKREVILVVNGDYQYDEDNMSTCKTYISRIQEIQTIEKEHQDSADQIIPALPEDSGLFVKIVENTKSMFNVFRIIALQIKAGIPRYGSDPEKDVAF